MGSAGQVVLILIVFACTGFTVAYIMKPVLHWMFAPQEVPWWAKGTYYLLILPIYNLLLLFYGFIFGLFNFFWAFEKKFFRRLFTTFKKPNQ